MRLRYIVFLLLSFFIVTLTLQAQDPITVAPDQYKKLYENDRVRVLEVNVKPGGTIPKHSHPDHVAYAVTACTLTITGSDGKAQKASLEPSGVVWFDAVTHSALNSGSTDCRVAVVELKEPKAASK